MKNIFFEISEETAIQFYLNIFFNVMYSKVQFHFFQTRHKWKYIIETIVIKTKCIIETIVIKKVIESLENRKNK